MRGKKDFDCVEMKWKIQQQLLSEVQALGAAEARKRRKQRVLDDPILGPFLAKLTGRSTRSEPVSQ